MEYLNLFKIFKIYYLFLCEFLISKVLFSTVTLKSGRNFSQVIHKFLNHCLAILDCVYVQVFSNP